MQDYLVKATAQGVRAFVATTTTLTEEARHRHQCSPVAVAALGRLMTASLLLAADLKTTEQITIRVRGDGGLGECVADANAAGTVRGYVKYPDVELPLREGKLDVGQAVGDGHIYVTRFTGLKQPFTGSCALVSGEIAEDIANYMLVSEQTPSTVALGVLVEPDMTVGAAGGFIVQALPDAADDGLTTVENNLQALPPVSSLIKSGFTPEEIAKQIFAGLDAQIYEPTPLSFQCSCSRDRIKDMLVSLGSNDLADLIQDGQAEIICHFCAEKYHFDKAELAGLLEKINHQ